MDESGVDARVRDALKSVIGASGVRARVTVHALAMPYLNAAVENKAGGYDIGVTKMLVKNATDAELRAVLGHEVAHILLGHRRPRFELMHKRTTKDEGDADALAARWFGKGPMRSILGKIRVDAMRLPQPSLRRRAIMELDERRRRLR